MDYRIYADRVKIFDAYLIPKDRFETELNVIRYFHPTCRLWKRSVGSIRREWASHVLAYSLGIRRDKTADLDLDYEPKWYHNFAYWVVGNIALLVIK